MKGSTFSSSGELSESQGLNDFLKAHNAKEELKLLDKASYLQSMNPRHNDLLDYYPKNPSKLAPNPYNFAQNTFGFSQNPGFYEYDDENFEEFAGEDFEEYEEKDPYDYEVDLNVNRKKTKASKTLDKSYEERKQALQKKRDEKKKLKEAEQKRREEELKRQEIELAAQLQKKIKRTEEKPREKLKENSEISEELARNQEKLAFDVGDAIEDSESHEKSVEEYVEPRLEVYDPEEMMKYMGKSGLLSQSQSQRVRTEEDSGRFHEKSQEPVYDARETNQYLRKSQEKVAENFENSEKYKEDFGEKEEKIEKSSENHEENKQFPPKLQPTTPEHGLEGIKKCNTDRFDAINSPFFQENVDSSKKTGENTNNFFEKPPDPSNYIEKSREHPATYIENPATSFKSPATFIENPATSLANPATSLENPATHTEKYWNSTENPPQNSKERPTNSIDTGNTSYKIDNFTAELLKAKEFNSKLSENEFLRQRVASYQSELEALVQQLSANERKVQELQSELSSLRATTRFSAEKSKIQGKVQENRLTNELHEQYLLEKEALELELERLREELKVSLQENARKLELARENRAMSQKKQFFEEETQRLKKELLVFQEFVRNPGIQRSFAAFSQKSGDFFEEDDTFRREFELQELLLKGFQKENCRNRDEIKVLRQEQAVFLEKLREKDQEILRIRARKAGESQKLLVLEGELAVGSQKNEYIGDFVVSKREIKEMSQKIADLQKEREGLLRDKGEIEEKIKKFERFSKENERLLKEIEEKNLIINEKDKEIEEKNREILEKNQEIFNRKEEIAEKTEEITKKTEEVARKNEEIAKKTEEIAKKNEEITKKTQEITKKNQEITKKNQEITKKTKETIEKVPEISRKSKHSNKETAKTVQNSSQIPSKLLKTPPKINNFLQETSSSPENPIFFAQILRFFSSKAVISLHKLYILLKNYENKRNSLEILKEIAEKTLNFPQEFAVFHENLHKILENGVCQDFDLLSLQQSFENSLFSLILSNNSQEFAVFSENFCENSSKMSDFLLLERKLSYIEGKYQQKEWEIAQILEELADPLRSSAQNREFLALKAELRGLRGQLEHERRENEEILKRKNKEIAVFKQELDELLQELERLRVEGR